MRGRIADFIAGLTLGVYSVIVLVEIWLTESVLDGELKVPGYSIFRKDRSINSSDKVRGGGVIIAVLNSLKPRSLSTSVDTVEQTFVELRLGKGLMIVSAVYIPLGFPVGIYKMHCNAVKEVCGRLNGASIAIFGDYNLPRAKWFGNILDCLEGSAEYVVAETMAYHASTKYVID